MVGGRGKQGVAERELACGRRGGREQEATEVDGEQVGAVTAPHRHRLEQAAAWHADLQRLSKRLKVRHSRIGTMDEEEIERTKKEANKLGHDANIPSKR
jgi:hypothetical protein